MSVTTEIATRVATATGLVAETSLFRGMMPASPDVCGAVYEYPGIPPLHGFGVAGIQHEQPGVQVVFRGAPHDYDGPMAMARAAYNSLAAVQGTTLGGTKYLMIRPQQSPYALKRDENERVYIACNYLCEKEPS